MGALLSRIALLLAQPAVRNALVAAVAGGAPKIAESAEQIFGRVFSAFRGGTEKEAPKPESTKASQLSLTPTAVTPSQTKTPSTPSQAPKTPSTTVSSTAITSMLPGTPSPTETAKVLVASPREEPTRSIGERIPTPVTIKEERVPSTVQASVLSPSAGEPTSVGRGIVAGFVPTGGGSIPTPPSPAREIQAIPISQIIEQVLRKEEKPTVELPLPEPLESRARPRPAKLEEILSSLIK